MRSDAGLSAGGPATIIASPLASRVRDPGRLDELVRRARAAIARRDAHLVPDVVISGDPAAIRAAAARAAERADALVVLAGGDGTVRDAAGALAGSGIEIGILPCGTGNLYASAIGVPRDLDEALEAMATGVAAPADVGEVRLLPAGRRTAAPAGTHLPDEPLAFGVACGTGFDAALIAATDREMKRRYSIAAYFIAATRILPTLAPRPTAITVDGVRTELESVVVLVANAGEAIPGRLRPRLPILADDGLLHVFVLPRAGILGGIRGVLELMTSEARGVSPTGHAVRLAGRHVRVEVEPAGPTQVDGDVFPPAWLDATVRPGGLQVIRPAAGAPAGARRR